MNDKAIEFEAVRFKTEKTIKKLQEAGLNVEKFENLFNAIINECNSDTKTMPVSLNDSPTGFATDYMGASYNKAIKKLELLQIEMAKYEIYLQVYAFTSYVKTFIAKPNKTEEEFKAYRDSIIDILNKLLKSQTLDYDVEGNIVDEMYQITYYFILEELKCMGTSETLKALSTNPIHESHLDKQIHQGLEKMNLKDPKYANLVSAMKQMDSLGINSNYVNEDFLRKLVFQEIDYDKIVSTIYSLSEKAKNYVKEANELEHQIDLVKNKNDRDVMPSITSLRKKILKNVALFVTSTSIITGMIVGSVKVAKLSGRKYKNTSKTYSVSDGIISETYYDKNKKNSVKIYEINPYEAYQFNGFRYRRIERIYDVSKFVDIPLEEYLDELDSLLDIGVKPKAYNHFEIELKEDDLYEEIVRYVREIDVDKTDYQEKINVFTLILALVLSTIIQYVLAFLYGKTNFNENYEYFSFISAIKSLIENVKKLRKEKKSQEELSNALDRLNESLEQLFNDNEEILIRLNDYYQMIKVNPDYIKETERIDDTIKLVRIVRSKFTN